jgi:hypothetical protein
VEKTEQLEEVSSDAYCFNSMTMEKALERVFEVS